MKTKQQKTKMVASMIVLMGLMIFSAYAVAGPLEPPAGPAPTMKTIDEAAPGTPIGDVPCTITQPGFYYLTNDCTAINWHGIIIECDDVTIDFKGFTINGSETETFHGIKMDDAKNIEIRNGTIRGFSGDGIVDVNVMHTGRSKRIINMRLISNQGNGISLPGRAHLIKDCIAAYNGGGGIFGGYDSVMTGNIAYTNTNGGIGGVGACVVTGNSATYNEGYAGISIGVGSVITGNVSSNNGGQYGLTHGIDAGQGSTVIGNSAYWNRGYGIYTFGNCLFDQNTAYQNNRAGGYANMDTGTNSTVGINHAP